MSGGWRATWREPRPNWPSWRPSWPPARAAQDIRQLLGAAVKGWKRIACHGWQAGPAAGHVGRSRCGRRPTQWGLLIRRTAGVVGPPWPRPTRRPAAPARRSPPPAGGGRRSAAVCDPVPGVWHHHAGGVSGGLERTRVFGPGVEALPSHLHERHHVSYERLQELCVDWFRLELSEGAIANCLQRVAGRRPAGRGDQGAGAREPDGRGGRDERAGERSDALAVGVPDTRGELPSDRPPAEWGGRRGVPGGHRCRHVGERSWKPQSKAAAAATRSAWRTSCAIAIRHRSEQSTWAQDCQTLFCLAIHRAHQRDAGELWGAAYTAAVRRIEADCDRLLATPVPVAEAESPVGAVPRAPRASVRLPA